MKQYYTNYHLYFVSAKTCLLVQSHYPEWKSFCYHVNSPWIPRLIFHVLSLLQVTLTSVFVWFYCNIQSLLSCKAPAWQFSCLIGMRLHVVQNSRKRWNRSLLSEDETATFCNIISQYYFSYPIFGWCDFTYNFTYPIHLKVNVKCKYWKVWTAENIMQYNSFC